MSYILSFDTSTKICSVALHQEQNLISYAELHVAQSHSVMLNVLIEQVLNFANLSLADISAICVAKGPGSYTGLRIGVSSAKGLCYALNKPLIAVNTLKIMVNQLKQTLRHSALLCPMIDARRMEVYCAVYNQNLEEVIETQAKIIDEQSFADLLEDNMIYFFGNGAEKCQAKIQHENAFFIKNIHPSAREMGSFAWEKFQKEDFEDVAYFEPYYLKDFVSTSKKQ